MPIRLSLATAILILLTIAATGCNNGVVTGPDHCASDLDCPVGHLCQQPDGMCVCIDCDGDGPPADGDFDSEPDGEGETVAGPEIMATPEIHFGAVLIGDRATRSFTVSNIGGQPLKLTRIALEAGTSTEFAIENGPSGIVDLPPGGAADYTVSYAPADPGADDGNIEILSSDLQRPKALVRLTSEYKGRADIGFDPESIVFGEVPVNDERLLTLRITARPASPDDNKVLSVEEIRLADEQGGVFTLDPAAPRSGMIPPGGSLAVPIRFRPTRPVEYATLVSIRCDDPDPADQSAAVAVSGRGVASTLTVTPDPVDFGAVKIGIEHSLPVTLTNIGRQPLTVAGAVLGPETAAQFRLDGQNAPGSVLGEGESAVATLYYRPDDLRYDYGSLIVTTDSRSNPLTVVEIKGTGIHASLSVLPPSHDFGMTMIGTTAWHEFRLQNDGVPPVILAAVGFEPADPLFLIHPDDAARLPLTIEGDAVETIRLGFAPQLEQAAQAVAVLATDDSRNPEKRLDLTGLGAAPRLVVSEAESGAWEGRVDFGDVRIGDTRQVVVRIANEGQLQLDLLGFGLLPGGSSDISLLPPAAMAVAAGGAVVTTLHFRPSEPPEVKLAQLRIDSNDPHRPRFEADVVGRATDPAIAIEPSTAADMPYDFGPVLKNATALSDPFYVINAGTLGSLQVTEIRVAGPDSGNFRLVESSRPIPTHLEPFATTGDHLELRFSYTPSGWTGVRHTGVALVASTDYAVPEAAVHLTGIGHDCPAGLYDCDDDPSTCEYACIPDGAERCDGRDNNCNCAIDEFPENLCPPRDHALYECGGAGGCQFAGCEPDHHNMNGSTADGCEYPCVWQSAADEPDLAGVDANCDGIDGVVGESVFISEAGSDASDGLTPATPVRSFGRAYGAMGGSGRSRLLVAGGSYPETVQVWNTYGIFGGYSPDFRTRPPQVRSVIRANPAMIADGVTQPTPVQRVHLQSPGTGEREADGRGADAIGLVVRDAPGVSFAACQIETGSAGAGAPGGGGQPGAVGAAGVAGQKACEEGDDECKRNCDDAGLGGEGGGGGGGACGNNGGAGGDGAKDDPGEGGQAGRGPAGGDGGNGSTDKNVNGGNGRTGGNGSTGSGGSGGGGGAPAGISSFWQGTNGGAGGQGAAGSGGGGGGAGAGSYGCYGWPWCNFQCWSRGGGGGGGGSGGCGGQGGGGGMAGGASIGVYAIRTSPAMSACTIVTGSGGRGGDGGPGGPGGSGGGGGLGGETGNQYVGSTQASAGGHGGQGGTGGQGGAGGGGAGGPSYGIVIWQATDGHVDQATRQNIFPGSGGPGGSGGSEGGPGASAPIAIFP